MNYDNNLRGALFKADKEGNEKRPDYTGHCEIDGTKYWLSAWIKTSKKGDKFMSLAFKLGDTVRTRKEPAPADESGFGFDDEIPF